MLEIALEIIICLLLATLIGFAMGYLVAKSQSEKSKPVTNNTETETKDNAEKETLKKETLKKEEPKTVEPTGGKEPETEAPTEENQPETEAPAEEESTKEALADEETTDSPEEIEIPTENVIGEALEALEALEDIEEEPEISKEESEAGQKPELLSEPRNGEKDDLTNIKGIGPKVEEKLNASGIYHFDQIANWTEENMIWLEAHTHFASRAKKEAWAESAKSFL